MTQPYNEGRGPARAPLCSAIMRPSHTVADITVMLAAFSPARLGSIILVWRASNLDRLVRTASKSPKLRADYPQATRSLQALRDAKWVAGTYELSDRSDNLSLAYVHRWYYAIPATVAGRAEGGEK